MAENLVGLGGLLGDPACCVIRSGELASAVEQAKLTRHIRPGAFPEEAFALALEVAGVRPNEIDCVAVARPFAVGAESSALLELPAVLAWRHEPGNAGRVSGGS